MLKGDERASEPEKSEVVGAFLFPPDKQPSVTIVPTIGALDDPAAWLSANTPEQWGFAATPDMRDDSTLVKFCLGFLVVVPFVETHMIRPSYAATATQRHGIQCFADHPLVVHIGPRDLHSQWHAARVGQHMAFDA